MSQLPTISSSLVHNTNPSTKKRLRCDDDDYVAKAGNDMQDFLDQFPTTSYSKNKEKTLERTLEQLEQDVTCIKSSLEKKRPKVTLSEVNDKVDMILEMVCLEIRSMKTKKVLALQCARGCHRTQNG